MQPPYRNRKHRWLLSSPLLACRVKSLPYTVFRVRQTSIQQNSIDSVSLDMTLVRIIITYGENPATSSRIAGKRLVASLGKGVVARCEVGFKN